MQAKNEASNKNLWKTFSIEIKIARKKIKKTVNSSSKKNKQGNRNVVNKENVVTA